MSDVAEIITIDGAGRVVIPSALRRRLHLRAGTSLRIEVDGECLRLEPVVDRDAVVEEGGVLVAVGALPGAWVDHRDVRDERARRLVERG